ncbi:plasmid replication protein RepC [Teichococcus oryzae]|uniref:plasmid replication protein RepC n=1 Tax=Teichococcus oryzae TaxID=1608942 RepID=UPI001375E88B|nr:plasmid replication protein RepC [Pseudoroseomonas oryzae]
METPAFPRGMTRGLRKLTTNHLLAARLVEQARGLPPGIRHPNQLLAAMRRAAPYLGYNRLLPLMEALFRWTQPQDWEPGAEPIVWPSNDELALVLDCSERHVSRLIAAAIEARLIVARDGADRRRRGFRQDGRIVWAWGLNLRPMAARHADFLHAAEEGERVRRRCRELRREAGMARQFLAQLLELAHEHGLPALPLEERLHAARQQAGEARRIEDPERLENLAAALRASAAAGRAWLEQAVKNAEMSGSGDTVVRPIIPTNKPTEPEGSIVAAREATAALALLPMEAEVPVEGTRLFAKEMARLAPRLGDYLATRHPDWGDIADAAAALSRHLGVPRTLYGEACRALGRPGAAVAIAIISTKPAEYFHSCGAGGYLRGMLRRAGQGQLHLERSIHGLRDAERRRRLQLTAVNSAASPDLASGQRRKVRYCGESAFTAASASGNHG